MKARSLQKNPESRKRSNERVKRWLKANPEKARAIQDRANQRARERRAMDPAYRATRIGQKREADRVKKEARLALLAKKPRPPKPSPDEVRAKRSMATWQSKLARRYRLAPASWDALLEYQGQRCAICTTDKPGGSGKWSTDHDHTTGQVRGLLCNRCNLTIGKMGDTADAVRLFAASAVAYLETVDARMAAAGLSSLEPPRTFKPSPVRVLPDLAPIYHAHPSAFPEPFVPC